MIKKISAITIPAVTYLTVTVPAFAQATISNCPKAGSGANYQVLCSFGINDLDAIIRNSVTILFFIATIAALFFLIFGGIKWITSGGDKANVESARNIMIAAAIGLILTFSAYFILNVILNFFGLNTGSVVIPKLTG